MTSSQIDYVNKVTNSCAIGSVPVSAKDIQYWFGPGQDCCNDRNQIAGFLPWIFTQKTRLVTSDLHVLATLWFDFVLSTYRIKVPKRGNGPCWVGYRKICQYGFAHEL